MLKRFTWPRGRLAGPLWGLISALIILLLWEQPPFRHFWRRVELVLYDLRLQSRPATHRAQGSKIAVVGINDADQKQYGKLPWPRTRYAQIVRRLAKAGAKAIVLDIYFSDPSEDEREDRALAEAIADTGIVFLPEFCSNVKSEKDADPYGVYRGEITRNLGMFRNAALGIGHINVVMDSDGIVRRIPARVATPDGKSELFPVSLLAALRYSGITAQPLVTTSSKLQIGPLEVPLDKHGCIFVNYLDFDRDVYLPDPLTPDWVRQEGRTKPIAMYACSEVLSPAREKGSGPNPNPFRDKTVLVGATLQGVEQDVHSTPVRRKFGLLIQAAVLNSVLEREFIRVPRDPTTVGLLFALCVPMGIAALSVRLHGSSYTLIGGALLILFAALSGLGYLSTQLYQRYGLMMHVTPFAMVFILHSGAILAANLTRARKEAVQKTGEVDLLIKVGEAASSSDGERRASLHTSGALGVDATSISAVMSAESASLRILESLNAALPTGGCVLYAVDSETGQLNVAGVRGFDGAPKVDGALRLASALNPRIQDEAQPLLIVDVADEPDLAKQAPGLRSLIAVPIALRGSVIGAFYLCNKRSPSGTGVRQFTPDDLRLVEATARQTAVAMENERLYREMHAIFIDYIRSMSAAIDARDRYTHGHSTRVAQISVSIARQLGLSPADTELIELAATVHDVGKIGVPEHVLNKPGKLTEDEFAEIKAHAAKGAEIVSEMAKLRVLVPAVRHHHERFDGTGYPDGLEGPATPLMARIIAVADAYDAMTSVRIYRPGMPTKQATAELQRFAGVQFDPVVVQAFLAHTGDATNSAAQPQATV